MSESGEALGCFVGEAYERNLVRAIARVRLLPRGALMHDKAPRVIEAILAENRVAFDNGDTKSQEDEWIYNSRMRLVLEYEAKRHLNHFGT